MRITWLFGASVIVTALFGSGLLLVPAWLLGLYGLTLTTDGEFVARVLGALQLGYVPLEWLALRGGPELRVAAVRSSFVGELLGLVVTAAAALQGRGNTLFLSVVATFLVFTIWRSYYLVTYRPAKIDAPAARPGASTLGRPG